MATFEERPSRQYPPKIEGLLKSMEKAQIGIKDLNEQLSIAIQEYNRLELEWEDYKASIAPIRICPPEVLRMIFHLYILENPRLVRRLLLVCKQWYSLVVNDPRMWNRICVTVPDEWDIESAAVAIERRINCCLQRSGTLLLELDLDLSKLRSAREQIRKKIRMCLVDDVSKEDRNITSDWSDSLDPDELLDSSTTTTYLPDSMLDVVAQLVGNTGEIMARWGTLNLHFPEFDPQLGISVWQICAWPAPNLNRMVVTYDENMEEEADELAVGFPEIPSLKHLDIFNIESLEFLKMEHPGLESLVIYYGVQLWNRIGLSRFTQLQRLQVADGHLGSGLVERFTLHLPKLRHLILIGPVRDLDMVDFRVPVLYTLDLVHRKDSRFRPLPKLQTLHVRWKIDKRTFAGLPNPLLPWSPIILIAEMKTILVQFDKAVKFTVEDFARSALIEAVRSLHASGEFTSALETIIVEKPDGEETILVASLCEQGLHAPNV